MEDILIQVVKDYLLPGLIGGAITLIGIPLAALGIIRSRKNSALYDLTFHFVCKIDAWGERKLGVLWKPVEKHLPSALFTIAQATKAALERIATRREKKGA